MKNILYRYTGFQSCSENSRRVLSYNNIHLPQNYRSSLSGSKYLFLIIVFEFTFLWEYENLSRRVKSYSALQMSPSSNLILPDTPFTPPSVLPDTPFTRPSVLHLHHPSSLPVFTTLFSPFHSFHFFHPFHPLSLNNDRLNKSITWFLAGCQSPWLAVQCTDPPIIWSPRSALSHDWRRSESENTATLPLSKSILSGLSSCFVLQVCPPPPRRIINGPSSFADP